jgi:hypothetical protein
LAPVFSTPLIQGKQKNPLIQGKWNLNLEPKRMMLKSKKRKKIQEVKPQVLQSNSCPSV